MPKLWLLKIKVEHIFYAKPVIGVYKLQIKMKLRRLNRGPGFVLDCCCWIVGAEGFAVLICLGSV